MNKDCVSVIPPHSVSQKKLQRRYSYGANPVTVSSTYPKVSPGKNIVHSSDENLADDPNHTRTSLSFQNQGNNRSNGSLCGTKAPWYKREDTVCDVKPQRSRKDESKSPVKGQDNSKYPTESVLWQEFIEYIISINSDIVDFKRRQIGFGSRDPSDDYVATVQEEINGKNVVWADNFRRTSGKATKRRGYSNAKQTEPTKVAGIYMTELSPEEVINETSSSINMAPAVKTKVGIIREDGVTDIKEAKDCRRRSNEVQSRASSRPISTKSMGERRHTFCGEDIKDIYAPKLVSTQDQGEGKQNDKPHSKWTVVKAELEDHHMKKLQNTTLGGWDFLAQTMAAMGNQASTRQLLYMRYLKRPNDWRRGFSSKSWTQYQYIFSEADLMKKDAFRWKNLGVKPPKLSDRILQKYRPKTSPAKSRLTRRRMSRSSTDFYESGDESERPVTAM